MPLWSRFMLLTVAAAALPVAAQVPQPGPANSTATPKLDVVVLDPAHGGSDSGARGPAGTVESEVVLDFARATRVALEAQGFRAVLTREGNQGPSFDERSALINGLSDAMFVSLHVASTGSPGTVRVYYYSVLPSPSAPAPAQPDPGRPPLATQYSGLIEWGRAQEHYVQSSRRLADLVQIQLAQRFRGSPEIPAAAAIRQLRTVAAPAIAIEVSSITSDPSSLAQMGQPVGEALARAAGAFRLALAQGAIEPGPAR
jgi:N-acetylmuramoyl-L-alanine amidase